MAKKSNSKASPSSKPRSSKASPSSNQEAEAPNDAPSSAPTPDAESPEVTDATPDTSDKTPDNSAGADQAPKEGKSAPTAPRVRQTPNGSILTLRDAVALGEGTRPKGFVFGETDGGLDWDTFTPAEGVTPNEIRIAKHNAERNPKLFVVKPRI